MVSYIHNITTIKTMCCCNKITTTYVEGGPLRLIYMSHFTMLYYKC